MCNINTVFVPPKHFIDDKHLSLAVYHNGGSDSLVKSHRPYQN
ncbi:hypothetical protein AOT82_1771 [Psychrobacter sp. AntiMn-1]|nr:hypothetical protein AOT82_1771 [Psychrobacter sp. AntiMn-1]